MNGIEQYYEEISTIILLLAFAWAGLKAQMLPFRLPNGAGTFRLGIVVGDESRWLDECELEKRETGHT